MKLPRITVSLGATQLILFGVILTTATTLVVGYSASTDIEEDVEEILIDDLRAMSLFSAVAIDRSIYQCILEWKSVCQGGTIRDELRRSNAAWLRTRDPIDQIRALDQSWISHPQDQLSEHMRSILESKTSQFIAGQSAPYWDAYHQPMSGEIFLTNAIGVNIGQTARTSDYYQADEDWWQLAKENGLHLSALQRDQSADMLGISVAMRVDENNGDFLGVLKLVINFDWIMSFLREYASAQERQLSFSLLDSQLRLIETTGTIEIDEESQGSASTSTSRRDQVTVYSRSRGYQTLPPLQLAVAASRPRELIFDRVLNARRRMAVATSITACAAILCWVLIMRSLRNRLNKVSRATHALREGHLHARAQVTGNDQIANLGRDFDSMAEEIESLAKRLKARSVQLDQRSRLLQREMKRRERLEDERRRIQIRMEESQRLESMGRLASGIAHEINTPAQYLSDNLSFLRSSFEEILTHVQVDLANADDLEFLQTEVPTAISQSEDGVRSISDIVNALKDFAIPSSDEMEQVDLRQVVKNSVLLSRSSWNAHCDLEFDCDDQPIEAFCYPAEIGQCLLNLFVNAAEAVTRYCADKRGRIAVTLRAAQDQIRLSVADNGCGLRQEEIERALDPLYSTKPPGHGNGQGLANTRRSVEVRHGGSLRVESEYRAGCTITMVLPRDGRKQAREKERLNEARPLC